MKRAACHIEMLGAHSPGFKQGPVRTRHEGLKTKLVDNLEERGAPPQEQKGGELKKKKNWRPRRIGKA